MTCSNCDVSLKYSNYRADTKMLRTDGRTPVSPKSSGDKNEYRRKRLHVGGTYIYFYLFNRSFFATGVGVGGEGI